MQPRLSILIACYNSAHYLAELIDALQNQTCPDWEAIIVDDASTQGDPLSVVDHLGDARVRCVRHTVNKGAGAAFNTAFNASTAPFVMLHGADDLLTPDCVEKMLNVLETQPDIDLVFANLRLFGAYSAEWNYTLHEIGELAQRQWIPAGGSVLRRELWTRAGGHYEGDELRIGNIDWDFLLALAGSGPLRVGHIDETLYLYRQHTANMTRNRSYNEHITRECMYKRHKAFIDAQGRGAAFVSDGYLEAAHASWKKGEPLRAAQLARSAANLVPPALPSFPAVDMAPRQQIKAVMHLLVALQQEGAAALAVNQKNLDARLSLAALYMALEKPLEAREQLEILLGQMIGEEAFGSVPDLLLLHAAICQKNGQDETAREAVGLALAINPVHGPAVFAQCRMELANRRLNKLIHLVRQLAVQTDGAPEALRVMGAVLNELHAEHPDVATGLEERLQTASTSATGHKNQTPIVERIYATDLGRRLHWSYRAKDLYETYGHLRGGFDALQQAISIVKPKRILEIGCGNGRNLVLFAELGIESVGQEIAASALELAKARQLQNSTLLDVPVTELPYPDGYFDMVVSNRVLQTVPKEETQAILTAVARMGKTLYLNELQLHDAVQENFYHYKHDYSSLLEQEGMRVMMPIHGQDVNALLFCRNELPL